MQNTANNIDRIAGSTIIQFTAQDPALLAIDAIIEEQDTNLLLGRTPIINYSVESFPRLVKQMEEQLKETAGDVIIKRSKPLHLVAIVYDIDHDPICEPAWVDKALDTILTLCEKHKVKILAMPMLGTNYGQFEADDFIELLQSVLMNRRSQYLKRILIYLTPE